MYVRASPLCTRYSPGAQKLFRICNDNNLRQPCEADSKIGSDNISRCKCRDTSPLSSSGNSFSVCNLLILCVTIYTTDSNRLRHLRTYKQKYKKSIKDYFIEKNIYVVSKVREIKLIALYFVSKPLSRSRGQ